MPESGYNMTFKHDKIVMIRIMRMCNYSILPHTTPAAFTIIHSKQYLKFRKLRKFSFDFNISF